METVSSGRIAGQQGLDGDDLRDPWVSGTSTRTRVGRIAAVIVVVASIMYWIVVLFVLPAAREDKLASNQFPRAAQPICQNALDDLNAAGLIDTTGTPRPDRADVTERIDTRLATMVARLRTAAPQSGDDAHAVSAWLDDWDQWLRDRATWVANLRAGAKEPFYEKQDANGSPNSKALNAFAVTNEMAACATPFGV